MVDLFAKFRKRGPSHFRGDSTDVNSRIRGPEYGLGSFAHPHVAGEDALRKIFLEEVRALMNGCKIHFWRNLLRIARSPAIVPPKNQERFLQLVRGMIDGDPDMDRFVSDIDELARLAPLAWQWFAWYIEVRPAQRSTMLMCRARCRRAVAQRVPEPVAHGPRAQTPAAKHDEPGGSADPLVHVRVRPVSSR